MPNPKLHERILVAEDDECVRLVLVRVLQDEGFRVLEAEDGRQALEMALTEKPALVVIDIEMPKLSGLHVIERLREQGAKIPMLVLSGRGDVRDRVAGLAIGADDYLTKPYEAAELVARVRALLRRHAQEAAKVARVEIGPAVVDLVRSEALVAGKRAALTRIECAIVELLVRHRGEPVSREEMLGSVWGYTYLPATRTLDTHIWRLRKKLGDRDDAQRRIKSLSGVGYQLENENGGA